MVAVGVDRAAAQPAGALDRPSRRRSARPCRRAPRSAAVTVAIRSDSLRRSSAASRIVVVPSAKQAARATRGSSSIASGTSAPPTSVACSRRRRTRRSPTGSPPTSTPGATSISAPIRSRIVSRPVRVGLSADSFQLDLAAGDQQPRRRGRRRPRRCRRGRRSRPARGARRARSTTASPSRLDVGAGGLSMRSVWSRLGSGSTTLVSPSASRPGEQQARLDLGAGDRQLVGRCRAAARPRSLAAAAAPRGRSGRRPSRAAARRSGRPGGGGSTRRRRASSSPPRCPASQPGSSRSRVPALPTSIVRRLGRPRRPTPRDPQRAARARDSVRRRSLDPRARAPRPRPASSGCRRRRGSPRPRSPPRPSPRSAPRGGRSTCPRAGAGVRAGVRPGRSGAAHAATYYWPGVEHGDRVAELADQLRGALAPARRRRPRARPRRRSCRAPDAAPCPRC